MSYRIISLDGGGLRGIISLEIMNRLLQEVPELLSSTDLFAGTSTGGLIAMWLADGGSPSDFSKFYQDNGEAIFDETWIRWIEDLGELCGAKYDSKNLSQCLAEKFGTKTLSDLKRRVLIPSFCLDNQDQDPNRREWQPKFMHNFPGEDSDGELTCVEVGLRTSAAPTYFPAHGSYVDGGMCANFPGMAALLQTQDPRAEINPRPALSEVKLLALGTGGLLHKVTKVDADWGLAHWAPLLIDLLMDADVGVTDYQLKTLLGGNYNRLAPNFPPGTNIGLDAWKLIPQMLVFAGNVDISETVQWLKNNW